MTNSKFKQNFLFWLVTVVVFLTGAWLRMEYFNRHLEYDEIWTLTHYVTKPVFVIFSDLATPNNHPLNTILVKVSTLLFGDGIIIQRLPAFISGIILLIIITHLVYLVTKSKFCTILALTFSALNGGLVYYSQTARGYEIQVLLITTFIYLLILREQYQLKNSLIVIGTSLISIASILTLPTSVIFIFPIALIHISYLIAIYYKNEKSLLTAAKKVLSQENIILSYLLVGAFSIIWFTLNYQQYKQGQSHGTSIESAKQLLFFGYNTLRYMVPLPVLFLSIIPIFFKKHAKFALAYFLLVFITFASALVFNAGPTRVYLPLIPIVCFAGSCGAYLLIKCLKDKISLILKIAFILVSFFYLFLQIPKEHNKWFAIDWQEIYNTLANHLPYNHYIYLPATAGYPAGYHNNYGIVENAKRTPAKNGFFVVLQEGIGLTPKEIRLTGINPISYNTEEILISQENPFKTIEFPDFNCSAIVFTIIPIAQTDTLKDVTLMTIFPDSSLKFSLDASVNKTIVLNSWLIRTSSMPVTLLLKNSAMPKQEMLQLEKQSKGHILFFTIKEALDQDYAELQLLIQAVPILNTV